MRLLIILPAVLVGAAVALVLWAAYDFEPFRDWEEMYD